MHQARAYFPLSVQPDKLKMLATRPLEHQVFMENFRTAHLNFWKQCHPVYPGLPEVPAVIKKILRCNWGHHKPKDPEKRAGGGGSKLCPTAPKIERLRFNKEHKKDQEVAKRRRTLTGLFSTASSGFWYNSKSCKVQKLGALDLWQASEQKIEIPGMPARAAGCRNWDPGCGSAGAVQRGRSWVNIPKTLNRARTVRQLPHYHAIRSAIMGKYLCHSKLNLHLLLSLMLCRRSPLEVHGIHGLSF